MTGPQALISFDIEEWFHVLDTDSLPSYAAWDTLPARAPDQTLRVLDLLDECGRKVTFFVLGWIAQKHPHLVREIHSRGHEIASHSFRHPLLYEMSREAVGEELRAGKSILEQTVGERVFGFRAPGFSIRPDNLWAFDCLAETGFVYDSSVFPARRAHGGIPNMESAPHVMTTPGGSTLIEIPVSVIRAFGAAIPFGGGGYLRLIPLWITQRLAGRTVREGRPFVNYVHPRDLDANTPRLPLNAWRTFKSYVGLRHTATKLRALLSRFETMRYIDFVHTHFGEAAAVPWRQDLSVRT